MTDAAQPSGAPGPARDVGRGIVGAVVVFAVVLGAVWWSTGTDSSDSGGSGDPPASNGPPLDEVERDERAGEILQGLSTAWGSRDETRFVEAAGASDAAREWASQVYDALADLGVHWIDLRYVAADSDTVADPHGFTADVEVRWEILSGSEQQTYRTSPVTVPLRFAYDGDEGVDLLGLDSGTEDPVPVWLTGPVEIESTSGGTCVGVPEGVDLESCVDMIEVAADDLAAVVTPEEIASQPVVVMVPAAESTAALLLGQDTDDLQQIAAVTTTVDGSGTDRAPAQVVLNPSVFEDLNRKAAQLVMSHEVTHAATGVTSASMELWVAEGFADYVALASGRIPVERAASQILTYVRENDVPSHLPTEKEFSAHRHGLGRTYEAAWLVFRMIGVYYGDDAVVEFYDAVRTGAPVEDALLDTIGLDLVGLTVAWQDYLSDLAYGAV